MNLIDLQGNNVTIESGIENTGVAQIFADHPSFSVHITDAAAIFSSNGDETAVFFACPYDEFYRNGRYVRISGPITINLWFDEDMFIDGLIIRKTRISKNWRDDTGCSDSDPKHEETTIPKNWVNQYYDAILAKAKGKDADAKPAEDVKDTTSAEPK